MNQSIDIEKIIKGCQNGDAKYQKVLYQKFAGKMLGICVRYCKDLELAKDSMQEAFVKVFNHIGNFNGESKVDTWMTRIMINTSLNHIKKSKKYELIEAHEGASYYMNNQFDASPDSVSNLSHAELLEVLNELPNGYRLVFNLYAIEGYNHREIGEKIGISTGTSKSQLNRARKQLQILVKEKLGYRQSV